MGAIYAALGLNALGPHAAYILGAYALAFTILALMLGVSITGYWRAKRALAAIETQLAARSKRGAA